MVEFEWDDANLEHIARHGVSADEVQQVIQNGTMPLEYQDWHDEERFTEVGHTDAGRVLLVVLTMRGNHARVVTAYEPTKLVENRYWRVRG